MSLMTSSGPVAYCVEYFLGFSFFFFALYLSVWNTPAAIRADKPTWLNMKKFFSDIWEVVR